MAGLGAGEGTRGTVSFVTLLGALVLLAGQEVVTTGKTRVLVPLGAALHLLLLLPTVTELVLQGRVARRTLAGVTLEGALVLTGLGVVDIPVVFLLAT